MSNASLAAQVPSSLTDWIARSSDTTPGTRPPLKVVEPSADETAAALAPNAPADDARGAAHGVQPATSAASIAAGTSVSGGGALSGLFSKKTLGFALMGAILSVYIPPLAFLGGPLGGAVAGAILSKLI
jgi:hypothetical protein